MIVVRLRSGLGNQMFQYAFFLQLRKWYGDENVKLDIDTYHWKAHNGRELDKVFRINLNEVSVPESISLQMADVGYSLQNRLLRRLRGKKHQCYKFWKDLSFEDYKHLPKDIYLEGYWPEERYFIEIEKTVRKEFCFPELTDQPNKDILYEINNTCSIGVHVRRGDYQSHKNTFSMCPAKYYREASSIIKEKKINLHFFIFSDDIKWCKSNLNFEDTTTFVCVNSEKDSYKDMMLMSNCKHQIIANSTFSWWAAWLNANPDKMVIYPSFMDMRYNFMPLSWIKIIV